jgi:hypothetical protein
LFSKLSNKVVLLLRLMLVWMGVVGVSKQYKLCVLGMLCMLLALAILTTFFLVYGA